MNRPRSLTEKTAASEAVERNSSLSMASVSRRVCSRREAAIASDGQSQSMRRATRERSDRCQATFHVIISELSGHENKGRS